MALCLHGYNGRTNLNRIDLDGQHAVVTGGAQGIGLAVAKRLAASGASLTLWDLDDAELRKAQAALGGSTGTQAVDISDADAVVAALQRTEAEGGPVSILVNSAGVAGPNATLDAYDLGWWRKIIDINLNGTFYVNRAVVPGTTNPIPFTSPVKTITLDQVQDVSDQVQLTSANGDYAFSIPLATLTLKPQAGQKIKADMGILRGNGVQTVQRVYWNNKATSITSDVPSEAELTPQLWGDWIFRAAP